MRVHDNNPFSFDSKNNRDRNRDNLLQYPNLYSFN